jgi:hypothetical protein
LRTAEAAAYPDKLADAIASGLVCSFESLIQIGMVNIAAK